MNGFKYVISGIDSNSLVSIGADTFNGLTSLTSLWVIIVWDMWMKWLELEWFITCFQKIVFSCISSKSIEMLYMFWRHSKKFQNRTLEIPCITMCAYALTWLIYLENVVDEWDFGYLLLSIWKVMHVDRVCNS